MLYHDCLYDWGTWTNRDESVISYLNSIDAKHGIRGHFLRVMQFHDFTIGATLEMFAMNVDKSGWSYRIVPNLDFNCNYCRHVQTFLWQCQCQCDRDSDSRIDTDWYALLRTDTRCCVLIRVVAYWQRRVTFSYIILRPAMMRHVDVEGVKQTNIHACADAKIMTGHGQDRTRSLNH